MNSNKRNFMKFAMFVGMVVPGLANADLNAAAITNPTEGAQVIAMQQQEIIKKLDEIKRELVSQRQVKAHEVSKELSLEEEARKSPISVPGFSN